MAPRDRHEYSEDLFADTRMSFGDHIEELRRHLLRALFGFTIGLVVSFFIAPYVLRFIQEPLNAELDRFHRNEVEKTLRNRDETLQKQDRPHWIQISTPRSDGAASPVDESALVRPLPENSPALPPEKIFDRAQLQLISASQSLDRRDWAELRELAPVLAQTAGFFDKSTAPGSPGKMAEQAERLTKSAKDEDFEAAETSLAAIQTVLGDQGLVRRWIRIDHPVDVAAALYGAEETLDNRNRPISTKVTESLMTYLKVSIICGLVLGSPWIFYQLWLFVAAGLYPHEKRYINVYLPLSIALFLGGVLLAQFFVLPRAVAVLLWFNSWLGQRPMLTINEWLNFALLLPVLTGASFQLPLVMLFLERIGVFTVSGYIKQWKMALFVVHVIAAVGPSVDPISMEMVALPMFGLYWFGILLCHWHRREPDPDADVPESEEMVEV
jgi:sec-independent protein translocase protein TatC